MFTVNIVDHQLSSNFVRLWKIWKPGQSVSIIYVGTDKNSSIPTKIETDRTGSVVPNNHSKL